MIVRKKNFIYQSGDPIQISLKMTDDETTTENKRILEIWNVDDVTNHYKVFATSFNSSTALAVFDIPSGMLDKGEYLYVAKHFKIGIPTTNARGRFIEDLS